MSNNQIEIISDIQNTLIKLSANDLILDLFKNIAKLEVSNMSKESKIKLLNRGDMLCYGKDNECEIEFYDQLYYKFLKKLNIDDVGQFLFDNEFQYYFIDALKKEFIIDNDAIYIRNWIDKSILSEKIDDLFKIYSVNSIDCDYISDIEVAYSNNNLNSDDYKTFLIQLYKTCTYLIMKYDLDFHIENIPLNAPYSLYEYLIKDNLYEYVYVHLLNLLSENNDYKTKILKTIMDIKDFRYWTNHYNMVGDEWYVHKMQYYCKYYDLEIRMKNEKHYIENTEDYLELLDKIENDLLTKFVFE